MSAKRTKKPYTRDSIERALIHHGVDYSPPYVGRSSWRVATNIGSQQWPDAMVYAFVTGLATAAGKVAPSGTDVDPVDEKRLRGTSDVRVWAEEFAKVYPDCDQGTMIGWFANAIENAEVHARAEAR